MNCSKIIRVSYRSINPIRFRSSLNSASKSSKNKSVSTAQVICNCPTLRKKLGLNEMEKELKKEVKKEPEKKTDINKKQK
uniref:Uncharacterized protein n=1 Tax=Acrobeloides nanus TaxID=290746 RepID=A0A914E1E4_9BILA